MESVREQLIPKIKALTGLPVTRARPAPPRRSPAAARGAAHRPRQEARRPRRRPPPAAPRRSPGCSQLPANLPVPVLMVQHMPPVFTRQFAQRLDRLSPLRVVEAADGTPRPRHRPPGPGDHHLVVRSQGRGPGARPHTAPQPGSAGELLRPAVDPLFRSVVAAYDGAVLAVVLTGMGSTRAQRAAEVRAGGGTVIVQDQATRGLGHARCDRPGRPRRRDPALDRIAEAINRHLGRGLPGRPAATVAEEPDDTHRHQLRLGPRARPQGERDRSPAGQGVPGRGPPAADRPPAGIADVSAFVESVRTRPNPELTAPSSRR